MVVGGCVTEAWSRCESTGTVAGSQPGIRRLALKASSRRRSVRTADAVPCGHRASHPERAVRLRPESCWTFAFPDRCVKRKLTVC